MVHLLNVRHSMLFFVFALNPKNPGKGNTSEAGPSKFLWILYALGSTAFVVPLEPIQVLSRQDLVASEDLLWYCSKCLLARKYSFYLRGYKLRFPTVEIICCMNLLWRLVIRCFLLLSLLEDDSTLNLPVNVFQQFGEVFGQNVFKYFFASHYSPSLSNHALPRPGT